MTQPQDGGPVMTLPNGETIREGEYGVTRDGQKVGPILRYTDDGFFHVKGTSDLRLANGEGVGNLSIIAKWHPVEAGTDPVTANYNDGKWHAWHGGECPVHPQSVVEAVRGEGKDADVVVWRADNFQECNWTETGKSSSIRVFRVVTPYAEPAPEPVKPAMRDLRTIDEPFGELDERTQKRLRKADKRGWPFEAFRDCGPWREVTEIQWHGHVKYRLDPTFTPPAKRATFWLTNGRVFQSAREAKTAYPGSDPVRVKECKK